MEKINYDFGPAAMTFSPRAQREEKGRFEGKFACGRTATRRSGRELLGLTGWFSETDAELDTQQQCLVGIIIVLNPQLGVDCARRHALGGAVNTNLARNVCIQEFLSHQFNLRPIR